VLKHPTEKVLAESAHRILFAVCYGPDQGGGEPFKALGCLF